MQLIVHQLTQCSSAMLFEELTEELTYDVPQTLNSLGIQLTRVRILTQDAFSLHQVISLLD